MLRSPRSGRLEAWAGAVCLGHPSRRGLRPLLRMRRHEDAYGAKPDVGRKRRTKRLAITACILGTGLRRGRQPAGHVEDTAHPAGGPGADYDVIEPRSVHASSSCRHLTAIADLGILTKPRRPDPASFGIAHPVVQPGLNHGNKLTAARKQQAPLIRMRDSKQTALRALRCYRHPRRNPFPTVDKAV